MKSKPAIVFVHGLIRPPFWMGQSFEYFRGVKAALADLPVSLHFPHLPTPASIKTRSEILTPFLKDIDADIIYLVGHSMGGLDCRYYASHHSDDHRIKRITSVASPHYGSPLANWVMQSFSPIAMIFRFLFAAGAADLTTFSCRIFNDQIIDRSDIEYFSYAAARPDWEFPIWLRLLVSKHVGNETSDGFVPVSSAQWGLFKELLHTDHLESSGWSLALPNESKNRPFDHIAFYRGLVNDFLKTSHNKLQEQHHERSGNID